MTQTTDAKQLIPMLEQSEENTGFHSGANLCLGVWRTWTEEQREKLMKTFQESGQAMVNGEPTIALIQEKVVTGL